MFYKTCFDSLDGIDTNVARLRDNIPYKQQRKAEDCLATHNLFGFRNGLPQFQVFTSIEQAMSVRHAVERNTLGPCYIQHG